ncbi:MAG TPA: FtsQ-type POTRA domain-containing protein [Bacteroidota bacterium]
MKRAAKSVDSPDGGRKRGKKALILTVLLLLLIMAAGIGAHEWKQQVTVGEIRIEGNAIVLKEEILKKARIELGSPLFQVDLAEVRSHIEENLFVRSADVKRDVRGGIAIEVHERKPVAALVVDGLRYVDAEGIVLPPINSKFIFDIPVVTGTMKSADCVPGTKVTDARIAEAVAIIEIAKRAGEEVFRNISEVHIDGEAPILYSAEDGIPIIFGSGDAPVKLVKFAGFWKDVVQPQGAHALKYIDLRFEDQVIVQWKPGFPPGKEKEKSGTPAG